MLGWVGWQLFGTTWVAERRHEQGVTALEQRWAAGERVARTDEGTAEAVVRIPRFGQAYAVPLLEGDSDEVLAAGYGHLEDTAEPGEVGNVVIAAHRITHGEPLRRMPELVVGDTVVLDTARRSFTYELITGGSALEVPFTAGWVTAARPVNPDGGTEPDLRRRDRLLTITTCAELFHTDERLVAFARLVDSAPRTPA